MARQELGSLLSPQVPIQNRGIDCRQIHHHQGIQRISELRVNVESKQFRVQFQILAQQYGNASSVPFRLHHEPVRFLNGPWDGRRRCWIHQWPVDGFHKACEIPIEVVLLKECHQETVRDV